MLKKQLVSLSVCAFLLATSGPLRAFARNAAQTDSASGAQSLRGARGTPRPGLEESLAGEVARLKADTSTKVDVRRLEKQQNDPRSAKPRSGYTKNQKILVASIVVGMVTLAVVLALTIEEGPHPRCADEPTDPFCRD